jgi:hypothetical protein
MRNVTAFARHVCAGWWAINPNKGSGQMTEPPVDKGGLQNAIPGTDPGGHFYGGDGPADIMDETLREIDLEYRRAWGRPVKYEELKGVFDFCSGPEREGRSDTAELNEWVDDAAKVADVPMSAILALAPAKLDEMRQQWLNYRNSRFPNGQSGEPITPLDKPTPQARENWESHVRAVMRFAQEDAKRILQRPSKRNWWSI